MKLGEKIKKLNESKKTVRWANIVIVWSCLEIIRTLLVFKQAEYNLISPLVPQYLNCEIYSYYVDAGLVASFGFVPTLILKLYQRNFWVAVTGTLTLISFHFYLWI